MRLGKLAADPIRLAASRKVRFGVDYVPSKLDRSLTDYPPRAFGNLTLPDCTFATLANCAGAVASLNGYELVIEEGAAGWAYSNFLGNPPNLEATDGASVVEVLSYQGARGFDVGPQQLVANWGTIDHTARSALALGMCHLGPIYLGGTLRERDMETSLLWDVQPGRDDGAVVGGHAFPAWCYDGLSDAGVVQIMTWGRFQPVTWEWLAARLDEAHGLAWQQLERADGTFFANTTYSDLISDIVGP